MELQQPLNHIAFIMDGNGRWAQQRRKPRIFGHQQGIKQIPKIVEACIEQKIQYISLFAFSTENWNRPKEEINGLMKIIQTVLSKPDLKWFHERHIAFHVIGFEHPLLKKFAKQVKQLQTQTQKDALYHVNFYVNYGSLQEIVSACNHAVKTATEQTIDSFNKLLLTAHLPPVDLLIRTGNEQRISNFLLWQCAYAEIIFEPTYWPAYSKQTLKQNILDYNQRKRRYGGL